MRVELWMRLRRNCFCTLMLRAFSPWQRLQPPIIYTGSIPRSGAFSPSTNFISRNASPARFDQIATKSRLIMRFELSWKLAPKAARVGKAPGSITKFSIYIQPCMTQAMPIASRHGKEQNSSAGYTGYLSERHSLAKACFTLRGTPAKLRLFTSSPVSNGGATSF